MAKAGLDVGELLLKLVARETGEISKVDYAPQKPEFIRDSVIGETHLERRTPESQGISSAFFTDLYRELNAAKHCNIHKMMFLRHGYVISECSFAPYDLDTWHVSYSMCKSIVGMAIGILVDEGRLSLDERIDDIFSTRSSPFNFLKKSITVKNLLNMTSGVDYNEAGAIGGNDWRKSYMDAGMKNDPGTTFEYNSMNTYMLSAIITEKTGMSMYDFVKERIFIPMGIHRTFWESCPQSITKGGWGLFIRTEDMAKLGQLYLQKGKWDGKQIVSESWVEESTKWQTETDHEDNTHYGYQLWINDDRPGSYAYNGMLGQNVFIYPDIDLVAVTNAGNTDVFQTSAMALIIRERIKNDIQCSDEPLPENPVEYGKLQVLCKSFAGESDYFSKIAFGGWKYKNIPMTKGRTRKQTVCHDVKRSAAKRYLDDVSNLNFLKQLNGKTYDLDVTGVGIFPIMMQIVHNNFTDGIHRIGFRAEDNNAFFIDVYEGIEVYRLQCGFDGSKHINKINMHGEIYDVTLISSCKRDEYNRFVIRNDIYYLEEACTRTMNIVFIDNENIEIRFLETPGTQMVFETFDAMAPDAFNGLQGKLVNKFFKGSVKEVFEHSIRNTCQPVITASLTVPEYKEIGEEETDTLAKTKTEMTETTDTADITDTASETADAAEGNDAQTDADLTATDGDITAPL